MVFFLSPIRPDEALTISTVSCPAEYVHSYLRVGEAVASALKVTLLSEFIGWHYVGVKGAGDPYSPRRSISQGTVRFSDVLSRHHMPANPTTLWWSEASAADAERRRILTNT